MNGENKPDWDDAPEWANYLTQDKSGIWWWSEDEPYINGEKWYAGAGHMKMADCAFEDKVWKSSLQSRPKPVISINWDSVPEHLNYFAVDEDGTGYFFNDPPVWEYDNWQCAETHQAYWTNISEIIQAEKMLLKRPK